MLVVDSKPRQEHLNSHRKGNLQQDISLQSGGQNPTDSGKWQYVDTYWNNPIIYMHIWLVEFKAILQKANFSYLYWELFSSNSG